MKSTLIQELTANTWPGHDASAIGVAVFCSVPNISYPIQGLLARTGQTAKNLHNAIAVIWINMHTGPAKISPTMSRSFTHFPTEYRMWSRVGFPQSIIQSFLTVTLILQGLGIYYQTDKSITILSPDELFYLV